MPYIGASNKSQNSFVSLKEKHSIRTQGSHSNNGSEVSLEDPSNKSITPSRLAQVTTAASLDEEQTLKGEEEDGESDNEIPEHNVEDKQEEQPKPKTRPREQSFNGPLPEEPLRDDIAFLSNIEKPPALARNTSLDSSASSYSEVDAKELFILPNESTHAYSYNPLSPNSLAVRLSILKRSLEIIIGHPDMLRDPELNMDESVDTPVQRRKSLNNLYAPRFESFSADRSAMRVTSQKWQPHRATLNAFVANSTTNFRNLTSDTGGISARSGKSSIIGGPSFGNINVGDISGLHRAASIAFLPSTFNKLNSEKSLHDINNKYGRRPNPAVTFREPFKDIPEGKLEDDNSSSTNTLNQEATKSDISNNNPSSIGDVSEGDTVVNDIDQFIDEQRANLMSLLDLLNETLEHNTSSKASDLHMISLFNLDKLSLKNDNNGRSNSESERRTIALKKTLLDSLAEPFFEHYNENNNEEDPEFNEEMEEIGGIDDSVSLSELRPQQDYGRILRTFTSTKNSAPQAIFTCSQQNPWQFKAANDLACLIFGISKNALRALTLLDLIHSDSRNFVVNKLSSTEGQELVFTGEIIGIMQPGMDKSNLVWASFWAKRKKDVLVCVFEKVPCDYADVMLNLSDFSVTSVQDKCGLLESADNNETKEPTFHIGLHDDSSDSEPEDGVINDGEPETPEQVKKSVKFANEISKVEMFSKSLAQLIQDVCEGKLKDLDDDLLPLPLRVSNRINYTRYFTLSHLSHHVPCAVSSTILENEIKLKIHGIPYQAGLFVVDSHNFQMISFNKSIIKNMFGYHFADMVGKPITDIIPSFAELIKYTSLRYPALNITSHKNRGLVLTEHFFRKLRAEMKGRKDEFYTSIGIDAIHRDGGMIKVDFQVRVMTSNILLLWITHSRDVFFSDYTTTPSQLHMLKENDLAVVSSGGSSTCSSNKSSSHVSTGTLKALSKISDYKEIKTDRSYKENSEKSSTISSKDSTVFEKDDKSPTDGVIDEGDIDGTEIEKDIEDPDLRRKLALARIYHKDKSQFVKDENFKVNQSFILSKISIQPSTDSLVSTKSATSTAQQNSTDNDANNAKPTTFLTTNENPIGAKKHVKKFSDFLVLQKMGEGAYGKVNLCLHKKERYIVVIKMIFKERILVDTWVRDRKLGTIPSEIQIMATLSKEPQENILSLLDFFEDDDYYYIETPVHGETGSIDLFDLIEFKTNMTEFEAKLIFKQVVSGLKYLHDQGIVHRDIKDENIIVDSQGFVKIIDFGSAAYVKSGPFDVFVGTIDYAAPEVLGGNPYAGKPQDIWAIGILLYTIVFKENPFYNIDEILEGELKFSNTESVSEQCTNLIAKILNRNVQKRPTIDDIFNDEWLVLEEV